MECPGYITPSHVPKRLPEKEGVSESPLPPSLPDSQLIKSANETIKINPIKQYCGLNPLFIICSLLRIEITFRNTDTIPYL